MAKSKGKSKMTMAKFEGTPKDRKIDMKEIKKENNKLIRGSKGKKC